MTTSLPSIAVIGAGSMGGAIVAGLLASGTVVEGGIRVTNRTEAKARALERPGVSSWALEVTPEANLLAVDAAAIVLLGVKPAMVPAVVEELAPALDPAALVISVAAGVTTATIESLVPNPVLRAMPNTPAIVRKGVTGLAPGSRATAEHLALGRALFSAAGAVVEVPEGQIDALSTISGSGPAYVFYLIEQFTATAVGLGFDPRTAAELVVGTFDGAVALLRDSARSPEELRRQVTSPNGTTERALGVLRDADLKSVFDAAVAAALARAKELAAGN